MSDDTAYTATLKAGAGFDSPWLVVRADSIEELEGLLRNVQQVSEPLSRAAKTLQGGYLGAPSSPAPAPAPAPAPQAPAPASPWDDAPAQPSGFSSGPAPAPQGGPSGGPAKDDPYYAPKPGTAFDAQPSPQGPPGDKSGIPMAWRSGNGQKGPWRGWMSAQDRATPQHLKDTPIFYRG